MNTQPKTRRAPKGMTLDVPFYVQASGALLGCVTVGLGLIYLLAPPERPAGVREYSVVAILEPTLGLAAIVVGAAVILCTALAHGRAIAHGLAAVLHGGYLVALVVSIVLTEPFRPTVTGDLAVAALIAHGGASLAYFQRGWH